jgi:hypothetical protein
MRPLKREVVDAEVPTVMTSWRGFGVVQSLYYNLLLTPPGRILIYKCIGESGQVGLKEYYIIIFF